MQHRTPTPWRNGNLLKNPMRCPNYLSLVLTLAATACVGGYADDSRYLAWMNTTEQKCAAQYGELPLNTGEKRRQFLKLGYDAYYYRIDNSTFASKLGVRYPNRLLTIDCIATAIPNQGSNTFRQ